MNTYQQQQQHQQHQQQQQPQFTTPTTRFYTSPNQQQQGQQTQRNLQNQQTLQNNQQQIQQNQPNRSNQQQFTPSGPTFNQSNQFTSTMSFDDDQIGQNGQNGQSQQQSLSREERKKREKSEKDDKSDKKSDKKERKERREQQRLLRDAAPTDNTTTASILGGQGNLNSSMFGSPQIDQNTPSRQFNTSTIGNFNPNMTHNTLNMTNSGQIGQHGQNFNTSQHQSTPHLGQNSNIGQNQLNNRNIPQSAAIVGRNRPQTGQNTSKNDSTSRTAIGSSINPTSIMSSITGMDGQNKLVTTTNTPNSGQIAQFGPNSGQNGQNIGNYSTFTSQKGSQTPSIRSHTTTTTTGQTPSNLTLTGLSNKSHHSSGGGGLLDLNPHHTKMNQLGTSGIGGGIGGGIGRSNNTFLTGLNGYDGITSSNFLQNNGQGQLFTPTLNLGGGLGGLGAGYNNQQPQSTPFGQILQTPGGLSLGGLTSGLGLGGQPQQQQLQQQQQQQQQHSLLGQTQQFQQPTSIQNLIPNNFLTFSQKWSQLGPDLSQVAFNYNDNTVSADDYLTLLAQFKQLRLESTTMCQDLTQVVQKSLQNEAISVQNHQKWAQIEANMTQELNNIVQLAQNEVNNVRNEAISLKTDLETQNQAYLELVNGFTGLETRLNDRDNELQAEITTNQGLLGQIQIQNDEKQELLEEIDKKDDKIDDLEVQIEGQVTLFKQRDLKMLEMIVIQELYTQTNLIKMYQFETFLLQNGLSTSAASSLITNSMFNNSQNWQNNNNNSQNHNFNQNQQNQQQHFNPTKSIIVDPVIAKRLQSLLITWVEQSIVKPTNGTLGLGYLNVLKGQVTTQNQQNSGQIGQIGSANQSNQPNPTRFSLLYHQQLLQLAHIDGGDQYDLALGTILKDAGIPPPPSLLSSSQSTLSGQIDGQGDDFGSHLGSIFGQQQQHDQKSRQNSPNSGQSIDLVAFGASFQGMQTPIPHPDEFNNQYGRFGNGFGGQVGQFGQFGQFGQQTTITTAIFNSFSSTTLSQYYPNLTEGQVQLFQQLGYQQQIALHALSQLILARRNAKNGVFINQIRQNQLQQQQQQQQQKNHQNQIRNDGNFPNGFPIKNPGGRNNSNNDQNIIPPPPLSTTSSISSSSSTSTPTGTHTPHHQHHQQHQSKSSSRNHPIQPTPTIPSGSISSQIPPSFVTKLSNGQTVDLGHLIGLLQSTVNAQQAPTATAPAPHPSQQQQPPPSSTQNQNAKDQQQQQQQQQIALLHQLTHLLQQQQQQQQSQAPNQPQPSPQTVQQFLPTQQAQQQQSPPQQQSQAPLNITDPLRRLLSSHGINLPPQQPPQNQPQNNRQQQANANQCAYDPKTVASVGGYHLPHPGPAHSSTSVSHSTTTTTTSDGAPGTQGQFQNDLGRFQQYPPTTASNPNQPQQQQSQTQSPNQSQNQQSPSQQNPQSQGQDQRTPPNGSSQPQQPSQHQQHGQTGAVRGSATQPQTQPTQPTQQSGRVSGSTPQDAMNYTSPFLPRNKLLVPQQSQTQPQSQQHEQQVDQNQQNLHLVQSAASRTNQLPQFPSQHQHQPSSSAPHQPHQQQPSSHGQGQQSSSSYTASAGDHSSDYESRSGGGSGSGGGSAGPQYGRSTKFFGQNVNVGDFEPDQAHNASQNKAQMTPGGVVAAAQRSGAVPQNNGTSTTLDLPTNNVLQNQQPNQPTQPTQPTQPNQPNQPNQQALSRQLTQSSEYSTSGVSTEPVSSLGGITPQSQSSQQRHHQQQQQQQQQQPSQQHQLQQPLPIRPTETKTQTPVVAPQQPPQSVPPPAIIDALRTSVSYEQQQYQRASFSIKSQDNHGRIDVTLGGSGSSSSLSSSTPIPPPLKPCADPKCSGICPKCMLTKSPAPSSQLTKYPGMHITGGIVPSTNGQTQIQSVVNMTGTAQPKVIEMINNEYAPDTIFRNSNARLTPFIPDSYQITQPSDLSTEQSGRISMKLKQDMIGTTVSGRTTIHAIGGPGEPGLDRRSTVHRASIVLPGKELTIDKASPVVSQKRISDIKRNDHHESNDSVIYVGSAGHGAGGGSVSSSSRSSGSTTTPAGMGTGLGPSFAHELGQKHTRMWNQNGGRTGSATVGTGGYGVNGGAGDLTDPDDDIGIGLLEGYTELQQQLAKIPMLYGQDDDDYLQTDGKNNLPQKNQQQPQQQTNQQQQKQNQSKNDVNTKQTHANGSKHLPHESPLPSVVDTNTNNVIDTNTDGTRHVKGGVTTNDQLVVAQPQHEQQHEQQQQQHPQHPKQNQQQKQPIQAQNQQQDQPLPGSKSHSSIEKKQIPQKQDSQLYQTLQTNPLLPPGPEGESDIDRQLRQLAEQHRLLCEQQAAFQNENKDFFSRKNKNGQDDDGQNDQGDKLPDENSPNIVTDNNNNQKQPLQNKGQGQEDHQRNHKNQQNRQNKPQNHPLQYLDSIPIQITDNNTDQNISPFSQFLTGDPTTPSAKRRQLQQQEHQKYGRNTRLVSAGLSSGSGSPSGGRSPLINFKPTPLVNMPQKVSITNDTTSPMVRSKVIARGPDGEILTDRDNGSDGKDDSTDFDDFENFKENYFDEQNKQSNKNGFDYQNQLYQLQLPNENGPQQKKTKRGSPYQSNLLNILERRGSIPAEMGQTPKSTNRQYLAAGQSSIDIGADDSTIDPEYAAKVHREVLNDELERVASRFASSSPSGSISRLGRASPVGSIGRLSGLGRSPGSNVSRLKSSIDSPSPMFAPSLGIVDIDTLGDILSPERGSDWDSDNKQYTSQHSSQYKPQSQHQGPISFPSHQYPIQSQTYTSNYNQSSPILESNDNTNLNDRGDATDTLDIFEVLPGGRKGMYQKMAQNTDYQNGAAFNTTPTIDTTATPTTTNPFADYITHGNPVPTRSEKYPDIIGFGPESIDHHNSPTSFSGTPRGAARGLGDNSPRTPIRSLKSGIIDGSTGKSPMSRSSRLDLNRVPNVEPNYSTMSQSFRAPTSGGLNESFPLPSSPTGNEIMNPNATNYEKTNSLPLQSSSRQHTPSRFQASSSIGPENDEFGYHNQYYSGDMTNLDPYNPNSYQHNYQNDENYGQGEDNNTQNEKHSISQMEQTLADVYGLMPELINEEIGYDPASIDLMPNPLDEDYRLQKSSDKDFNDFTLKPTNGGGQNSPKSSKKGQNGPGKKVKFDDTQTTFDRTDTSTPTTTITATPDSTPGINPNGATTAPVTSSLLNRLRTARDMPIITSPDLDKQQIMGHNIGPGPFGGQQPTDNTNLRPGQSYERNSLYNIGQIPNADADSGIVGIGNTTPRLEGFTLSAGGSSGSKGSFGSKGGTPKFTPKPIKPVYTPRVPLSEAELRELREIGVVTHSDINSRDDVDGGLAIQEGQDCDEQKNTKSSDHTMKSSRNDETLPDKEGLNQPRPEDNVMDHIGSNHHHIPEIYPPIITDRPIVESTNALAISNTSTIPTVHGENIPIVDATTTGARTDSNPIINNESAPSPVNESSISPPLVIDSDMDDIDHTLGDPAVEDNGHANSSMDDIDESGPDVNNIIEKGDQKKQLGEEIPESQNSSHAPSTNIQPQNDSISTDQVIETITAPIATEIPATDGTPMVEAHEASSPIDPNATADSTADNKSQITSASKTVTENKQHHKNDKKGKKSSKKK